MRTRLPALCALLLSMAAFASAATIQGVVTNGTTGKPAVGAQVVLLSLENGMNEAARTRTDSAGRFTFDFPTGPMPHLVRVSYQSVSYFKMVPPGITQASIDVYDSATKLPGISRAAHIVRMESDGAALQVMELHAVENQSQPPRTLAGASTLEIALPAGATGIAATARSPNGQPIAASATPVVGKPDLFAFDFPLRPGETQFQLSYTLPYSGQATFRPRLLGDVRHFVAMVPRGMKFTATSGDFAPLPDESGTDIEVIANARANTPIAFTVSGAGKLNLDGPGDDASSAAAPSMPAGPGGGLGRPIGAPDPLARYRWPLLGLLALLLFAGGVYIRRPTPSSAPAPPANPQ